MRSASASFCLAALLAASACSKVSIRNVEKQRDLEGRAPKDWDTIFLVVGVDVSGAFSSDEFSLRDDSGKAETAIGGCMVDSHMCGFGGMKFEKAADNFEPSVVFVVDKERPLGAYTLVFRGSETSLKGFEPRRGARDTKRLD